VVKFSATFSAAAFWSVPPLLCCQQCWLMPGYVMWLAAVMHRSSYGSCIVHNSSMQEAEAEAAFLQQVSDANTPLI
jgi:hypothetical protein